MRGYRVLIVDDDPIDRRHYFELLAELGPDPGHIRQAADGAAGLAALAGEQFNCVLLDFQLQDMTGLEFLDAAAADGELPCAIVLVTGHGNEAIAVEAMKRGALDYLVKDQVNANSLWRAMTQAVTQKELQQRLAGSLRDLSSANVALEQEITIRKAAEAELRAARDVAEQANQAKTRFVAMVTHELRTPLNGILGYAQLLRIEAGLSVRQSGRVEAMTLAGRHLLEMIERVLDFASIEAGRMELHPVQVSVHDLTEGCIAFVGPMATERALGLWMVNAHDAPRQIVADPARLRQVLLNLLGNAVKYTDSGRVELRVLAGTTHGALRFEVADTGRGIDEGNRTRLFQDFERLETATSVEGAGLGLAIAARIVRLMGGTIQLTANPNATNPDGGSIFWFELPGADHSAQPPSKPMTHASSSSGRRVLLVDDIKINLDIIASFLEAAGYAVVLADNGQDAIRLAAQGDFDLILMDVRMPEMDGLEATRRIRMLAGCHGQTPILALTAYTSLDQVAQCLDAGMDGHVPKPVDYETLIRAVDDAIARVASTRADAGDLLDRGVATAGVDRGGRLIAATVLPTGSAVGVAAVR
jgi:signal transduction histidine kinase